MPQPARSEKDGQVAVNRLPDDTIELVATQDGRSTCCACSEYNAWRIFGMLALMLGAKLPAALGRSIKL